MSRSANALIAIAVALIALGSVCWHYTVTDQAFTDGKGFQRQRYSALATAAFWLDRASIQIRLRSPMERGTFLYERTRDIFGTDEANRYYDAAVEAFTAVTGPTEADVAEALDWAALALWYRHRFRGPIPEAEDYLRRSIAIRQRLSPNDSDAVEGQIELLVMLLVDRGVSEHDQRALAEAKNWNDRLLAKVGPNGQWNPRAIELCGDIAAGQKQWAVAERCYKEAYDAWQKSPGGILNRCAEKLVQVLRAQGKTAEADVWSKRIPEYEQPM